LLINLKPIVRETIGFLRASLPATIELRQSINPKVEAILGDPTQMQQILMNLCTNASHAMEGQVGVLEIGLDNALLTDLDRRMKPDIEAGRYIKLTVTDTGRGMDSWVRERIFEPYFTTKGAGKGTGLGLAVVHGIVKAHAGVIEVHSELGKGSSFTIWLPVADGIEKPKKNHEQPLPLGTERVLYVDDEKALAELYTQQLNLLGYRTEFKTSSTEALQSFESDPNKFDAVITDLTMPHKTGLNLAKELLAIRPDLPIILCTGFSDQINEEVARCCGISAFLHKPVLIHELADALRKSLNESNGSKEKKARCGPTGH
jgi:two-component system, cell cycle sensor histidine kinase and response regulator CckA